MNNYEEMRIESDVFATARENFDLLMQRLFKSMEKNNSDEGSITLKVDLQMSQDWVSDCIFCGDYHKPCNVGMVPIFCVINYK